MSSQQQQREVKEDSFFVDLAKRAFIYCKDTVYQTGVLLLKNFLLYLRKWKSTILQLFAPVGVICLLILLSLLVETRFTFYYDTFPRDVDGSKFENCRTWSTEKYPKCFILAYSTNQAELPGKVIDYILKNYDIPSDQIQSFPYENDLIAFLDQHPNVTQTAISFNNQTDLPFGRKLISYTILFNATADVNVQVPEVQLIVDNAIVHVAAQELGHSSFENHRQVLKTQLMGLPRPRSRVNGLVRIMGNTGSLFFSLAAMIILVVSTHSIVVEKEDKLRFGMKMMGLRDLAYWISWLVTFTIIAFLSSMFTVLAGLAFRIYIFVYCNFLIIFLVFFIFQLSLVCCAFLLSTFFRTGKIALIVGFIIIALSFILTSVLSNQQLIHQLYSPDVTIALPILFSVYPPFNFAKMFSAISTHTSPIYNPTTRDWDAGKYFGWEDFGAEIVTSQNITIPPPVHSLYILLGICGGSLILSWYLDNILPTGSGISRHPFFFITPSYWGISFKSAKLVNEHTYAMNEEELNALDEDIKKEYMAARNPDKKLAIRIMQLKKNYYTFPFKKLQAIRGLDLIVDEGQCLALLGHNGAGKTTTISVLIGLIKPSHGDARIFGKSVKYHIDEIRKILGVCPQYDILWPDLTAYEHLLIFCMLKGVPWKLISGEIKERLNDVELWDVRLKTTQTFSGGMKRRLSVAISCIGDPRLILLDEPTTGMDPASRRHVWKLIHNMKKSRAIVLTTHSMEEADALSDRIAIMAGGLLKAVGDGLHLKKKYGAGYNLTLVAKPHRDQELKAAVQSKLGAQIVAENAGSFVFNISNDRMNDLADYLELVESTENTDVKDWGISHTTLEEVYLKVTDHSDYVFARDTLEKSKEEEHQKQEGEHTTSETQNTNDFGGANPNSTDIEMKSVQISTNQQEVSSSTPTVE